MDTYIQNSVEIFYICVIKNNLTLWTYYLQLQLHIQK